MSLLVRHTDVLGGWDPAKGGGGIVGGFLPHSKFLGWRTYDVVSTHDDPNGIEFPAVRLRQTSGPLADTIAQVSGRTAALYVNRDWPYAAAAGAKGSYPSLAWWVMDPSTMALVAGPLLPLGNTGSGGIIGFISSAFPDKVPITEHVLQWFELTPPTGPYIAVLVSREPTADFPLWVSGTPVDIVSDLLTRKGEPFNATSATTAVTAMGSRFQHIEPITDAETPQAVMDRLSEAHGFTLRRSATNGETEFVRWREKLDGLPTPVLDDASIRSVGNPTFDLPDTSRVNRVRVTGKTITRALTVTVPETSTRKLFGIPIGTKVRWRTVPAPLGTEKTASGLVITDASITFDYSSNGVDPDADRFGEQLVEIEVGGMPGVEDTVNGGAAPLNFEQWAEGVARLFFDGHARGRAMSTAVGIRGTDFDDALLGEAVTLDLDHAVNPQLGQDPTSQRAGPRPYRVISRTEEPPGPIIELADEGTGVPLAIDIVLTVKAGATPSGTQLFTVSVSPADDLALARAQVEFQCLTFGPAETPDLTDPGFRYTIRDSSGWTAEPWPLTFGEFPQGMKVYFRARAFLFGGAAGNWSNWTGIGGPNTGPGTTLSNLTITNITDTSAQLDWSYDESPQVGTVRVQYRDVTTLIGPWTNATGSPFAAGTETTTLTGLTVGHTFEVRVILLDGALAEYGDELLGSFVTTGGKISSLVISSVTADGAKLNWTNTDGSRQILVEYRVDGTTQWQTFAILPATSNRTRLTGLAASTTYNVQVSVLVPFAPPLTGGLPVGDGAGGAALTDDFTTLAVSVTLEVPLTGGAFWDWDPATSQDYDGRFGLRLHANPNNAGITHDIIVLLAVETAVDSETAGAFVEQLPIRATPGVDLWFVADAPNDDKKRYMKAISRAVGYTDSIETIVEEATPWADTGPQPPAGGGITNTYTITASGVATTASVTGFFAVPDGAEMFRVESPNGKDIRIRLYTDSTVLASDSARASSDSNWPVGILYDGEILSTDSFLIDLPSTQRVTFLLSQHENRVVWYRLTNLEAGTEDLECRIYYFAATTGGPGTLV